VNIETIRDMILSIQGAVFIILMLVVTVLALALFRKVKRVVDAFSAVTTKVQQASSSVNQEPIKVMLQILSLVQGVRNIRDAFRKGGHGGISK
jgi:hypothetical protein